MEANAGFTDITEDAAKELGIQMPGAEPSQSNDIEDITDQARKELGLDPTPDPTPTPDFHKLFSVDDPFETLAPETRADLDALYEKSFPDANQRLDAKRRVAGALFFSQTMHVSPKFAFHNFDAISQMYFKEKMSDDQAYRRMQLTVNPDIPNQQSFLQALWKPALMNENQEHEKDILSDVLGLALPWKSSDSVKRLVERASGMEPEESAHPVLDRIYATELGQRVRRGTLSATASMMQMPAFLTKTAMRAGVETRNEQLDQNNAFMTGTFGKGSIELPAEVKNPDLSFVDRQQLTEAAKALHDYAGKTVTPSDLKGIVQTYQEDGISAAARKIGLDTAEGAPFLIPLIVSTALGGPATGAAFLYSQAGAEKSLETMNDPNMSSADKEADAQAAGMVNGLSAFARVPMIDRLFTTQAGRIASLQFGKDVARGAAENEAGAEFARSGSRLADLLAGHAKDENGQPLDPKKMSVGQMADYSFAGALEAAGPNLLTGGLLGSMKGRMSFNEQDALNRGLQSTAKAFLDKCEAEPPPSRMLKNLQTNLKEAGDKPAKILDAFAQAKEEASTPGFEDANAQIDSDVADAKAFFETRNKGMKLPGEPAPEEARAEEPEALGKTDSAMQETSAKALRAEEGFVSKERQEEARRSIEEEAERTEEQNENLPEDLRYMLAGEKSLEHLSKEEKEAEAGNFDTAIRMESEDVPNERIRFATGWFRSKNDGEWRREIDDSKIKSTQALDEAEDGTTLALPQALEGLDEHIKAYPFLKDTPVHFNKLLDVPAVYSDGEIWMRPDVPAQVRDKVLIHEIQHDIQEYEGFSQGGTVAAFAEHKDPRGLYNRLAGEREANDSMRRSDFTTQERKIYKPYGVDKDRAAIIKMGDAESGSPELSSEERLKTPLKIVDVKDDVFQGKTIDDIRPQAKEYAKKNLAGTYLNDDTGWNIKINERSVDHLLYNEGAQNIHLIPALPEIIRSAILQKETPHTPPNPHFNAVYDLYGAFRLRGELYSVKLTVKNHVENGKVLYDCKAASVQKITEAGGSALPAQHVETSGTGPTRASAPIILRDAVEAVKRQTEKNNEAHRALLESIAKRLFPKAPIEICATVEDAIKASGMPEKQAEQVRAGRLKYGFHYQGKSYLIAKNVHTEKEGVEVVLHEAAGHGGLRALFSSKEDFERTVGMMADHYGIKQTWKNWQRQAEERFAKDMESFDPEKSPNALRQIWTSIKLAIGKLLDKLGIKVKLSDADIQALIAKSYKAARAGKSASWGEDLRFNEAADKMTYGDGDERMPLDISDAEQFDHAANYGMGLIRDGLSDFGQFEQRMGMLFKGLKAGEARRLFDEALLRFHEAHGETRTVADIRALLEDPKYAGDYHAIENDPRSPILHAEEDMPRDPRAIRMKLADGVELQNIIGVLDDALKRSVAERNLRRSNAIRSVKNAAERALAVQKRGGAPNLPSESRDAAIPAENARNEAEAKAKDAAKAAKLAEKEKAAKKLNDSKDLSAFIEEHKGDSAALLKELKRREREQKKHSERQRELADFDRWLEQHNSVLWKMRHDLDIHGVRPPEGADPFEDSSYIGKDFGRTWDEVASMLKIDGDDLLAALEHANEKELWKQFRAERNAEKQARRAGRYDEETLFDASKEGKSEEDLLRDDLASKTKQARELKKSNERLQQALGFQKTVAAKLRAGKYDTIESLKQLQKEINDKLPPEERGKYDKQFVRVLEASARPPRDGGSMSNRALLMDTLFRQIEKDADKARAKDAVEGVYELLNRAKLRKDSNGKPVGKFDPATTRRIGSIREIVDLTPEQIDERLEDIGERLDNGDYSVEPDPDKTPEEAAQGRPETQADLLLAHADLKTFGKLNSQSGESAEAAFKELKRLEDTGRTYYEEAIREEERKQIAMAEEMLKQVSGEEMRTLEEADEKLSVEARNVARAKRASRPFASARDFLADFHRRNLSWEWLLNSLARNDKLSPTLQGFIKTLAQKVHKSSNAEETGFTRLSSGFLQAFRKICDCESVVKYIEERQAWSKLRGPEETKMTQMKHFAINRVELGEAEARQLLEWWDKGRKRGEASPVPDVQSLQSYQAEGLRQQLRDASFNAKRHLGQHEKEGQLAAEDEQRQYNRMELNGENPKEPRFSVDTVAPTSNTYNEGMSMTWGQGLYCWLAARQPDARAKMVFEGWTPETFDALEKFLPEKVKEAGRWMAKEIAADKPNVDAAYLKCFHVELGSGKNYFPLKYDKPNGKGKADAPTLVDGRPAVSAIPGSLRARVFHHAKLARADAIDQYLAYGAEMEHFKAWGETMRELRGIFDRRAVRLAIEHYSGPEAYQAVQEKLEHFATGGNRNAQRIPKLDELRNRLTIIALGAKVSVAVQQLLSLPMNSVEIPARDWAYYTLIDLPQDVHGKLKPLIESEFLKNRWGSGFDRDLISYMHSSKSLGSPVDGMDGFIINHLPENWRDLARAMPGVKDAYADKAAQLAMIQIRACDAFAILSGGYAVYKYHLDRLEHAGVSHEEAHQQALLEWEMAQDRWMQAGGVKDLGLYQEGGSIGKMCSMFLSYARLCYAGISEHILDACYGRGAVANGGKLKAWEKAGKVFLTIEALGIVCQLARDVSTKGLDFDRWRLSDYILSLLTGGTLQGLFLVGSPLSDLLETGIAKAVHETPYGDGGITPAFEDGTRNLEAMAKMFSDPEHADFFKGVEATLKSAGYVSKPAAVGASIVGSLRQVARAVGLYDDNPKHKRRRSE